MTPALCTLPPHAEWLVEVEADAVVSDLQRGLPELMNVAEHIVENVEEII